MNLARAPGGCRCGSPGATRCAHRGRSVLVLVMIALPVLAVTAADVLIQTSTVSGVESIDRRMGGRRRW